MAEKSEMIRSDIERTRMEMGDTLDALGYKANVPARTRGWVGSKKDAVLGAGGSVVSKVSDATDSMVTRVSGVTPSTDQVKSGAGSVKDTAERNPLGLALAGAAIGFVSGLFAPGTRIENEKIGAVSDQVKSSAAEVGKEALERGKDAAQEVAQATAETAVETAKEQGRQHGDELSSTLENKARDLAST